MTDTVPPAAIEAAYHIGTILEKKWPTEERNTFNYVAKEHVEAIGEAITACVAEILQAWIHAGSERDNTMEELLEPITNHVKSWITEE